VFDHVTIRVEDREASERFYDTVLRTLGVEKTHSDEQFAEWDDFSLAQASDARPVTRRLHIGFGAPLRADVDEFWRTGTEAGYRDAGAPGERSAYHPGYYGAYVRDPDGNTVEVVNPNRRGGAG
jgi:catechol 2,3-dioxygenase-like lactoylglutathione lyase family enzyme